MTAEEYMKLALQTESTPRLVAHYPDGKVVELPARYIHGVLGGASEAAEQLDPVKKLIIYGKPLDHTNQLEEIGDDLWYAALKLASIDATFADAFKANIAKLAKRYPGDKFSFEAALNRDLTAERTALESFGSAEAAQRISEVENQLNRDLAAIKQRGVVVKTMPATDDQTLASKLHAEVDRWLARMAPRVRDDTDYATLKFTIHQPQCDDDADETLILEYRVEEEACTDGQEGQYGTIPGVRFK